MSQPVYKRILLKLSGEALKGNRDFGINFDAVEKIALNIKKIIDLDVQVALVIGAGNIFRGLSESKNNILKRVPADYMGMLATVMNAVAMQNTLEYLGCSVVIQSAIKMDEVAEHYNQRHAIEHLEKGKVVIFAAGTGNPYFTTDTAAALRANEINANILLKATKVNGIYNDDPEKNPNAQKYDTISYADCLSKRLKIMDSTAFSLCMDNDLPIVVFNFSEKNSLENIICGNTRQGTLVKKEK